MVTLREVHRAHQKRFRSAHSARDACMELADRGYLRRADQADRWTVSPYAYSIEGDRGDTRPRHVRTSAHPAPNGVTGGRVTSADDGDSASPLSADRHSTGVTAATAKSSGGHRPEGKVSPLSPGRRTE